MINSSEVIIIGTGPISLLKCWLLLKNDHISKITLIDSKNTFGGAWYCDSHDNYTIETGCHIWSYCPKVYNFISSELGIVLAPFESKPIFKRGNFNLPYSLKNTIDSYLFLLKGLIRFDIKIFSKIKNSSRYYLNLAGKKNLYPKTGSFELTNTLFDKISNDDRVSFIFENKLNKIEINSKVILDTKQNSILTADKIFLTSTANLSDLKIDAKVINFDTSVINYVHFKLELNCKPNKTSSYVRVANDNVIHRISDISYQTENKNHLLLVAVFEQSLQKMEEPEIIDYIKKYLTKHGIILEKSEFIMTSKYEFPTYYTDQNTRDNINNLDQDRIELMHSTDLMYGIHQLLTNDGII